MTWAKSRKEAPNPSRKQIHHIEEGFFALVVAAVVYCCLLDDEGNGDMLHLTTEEKLAPGSACQNGSPTASTWPFSPQNSLRLWRMLEARRGADRHIFHEGPAGVSRSSQAKAKKLW